MKSDDTPQPDIEEFADRIRKCSPGSGAVTHVLRTSERVLRRVTDGIYREPWAALRELITNAYDADATSVEILTDPPRFSRLTVRDNGLGFSSETLASMCLSIGGSPKRTERGIALGVTDANDATKSPSGRRLIGKLGIGLFAVSQLTHRFRIISKVQGEHTRTVAEMILYRYSEDSARNPSDEVEATGYVNITKIPAHDIDAHGTDVVIDSLLPRTRAEFQSTDLWDLLRSHETSEDAVDRPTYHMGLLHDVEGDTWLEEPNYPWDESEEDPAVRFRAMANAMFQRGVGSSAERRPSLSSTFDNYLKFIWLLSLSAPLDYVGDHPFDLKGGSGVRTFVLGASASGGAEEIKLGPDESLRDRLSLRAPERGNAPGFQVFVDGLELKRPIQFTDYPSSSNVVREPLLFVGSANPDMSKYDARATGGDLAFEGYLLWKPRVVPREHNGVLLRVGDSSGSLFDQTFMKYQISEQTRREQITSEIFVHEGMDAALHIDRESFNHSHPHYQFVASWLHDAFKQFATKHKSLGSEARSEARALAHAVRTTALEASATEIIRKWTPDESQPIVVQFREDEEDGLFTQDLPALQYSRSKVFKDVGTAQRKTEGGAQNEDFGMRKLAAIAQLLHAAGALDHLNHTRQEALLRDIAAILFFVDQA